ncbi:hypothetical protein FB451DRAFT_716998 [Mycena latifolia]|nr:hypothetical protein FB451DRAFT_716998 [Mycena latifolia]
MHPPMTHLVQPLLKHFMDLVDLCNNTYSASPAIFTRIKSNFTNIQNILIKGLNQDNPNLINAIYCTLHFNRFSILGGHGRTHLMDQISNVLPQSRDYRLEVYFITHLFFEWRYHPIPNAYDLIDQALACFPHFDDANLKCNFYESASEYYETHENDIPQAFHLTQTGLSLSISTGKTYKQSTFLARMAWIKWGIGDYSGAQVDAYEARRLAKISGDLFKEAAALRIESICWRSLGRYSPSVSLSKRARELLSLCGMSGGQMDYCIMVTQAEVHRSKSEYIQAHNIQLQIFGENSVEKDPYHHALALLNIVQIDIELGASKDDVQRNIDTANRLLNTVGDLMASQWCNIYPQLSI